MGKKCASAKSPEQPGLILSRPRTGFSGGGATVADVALMRHTVGPKVGVKASGGVRSLDDARKMVAAGANRIGASSGVRIIQEAKLAKQGSTQILRVAEAVLYVSDLPRAKQFYTEVLGLPLSQEFDDTLFLQTGQNSTLILFELDKLEKRVSVIPQHGAKGRGHVCFAISPEQMNGWRGRLIQHGVEIEHEQDWSLGTHSIYFRDPDGNSLELMDGRHYRRVWRTMNPS